MHKLSNILFALLVATLSMPQLGGATSPAESPNDLLIIANKTVQANNLKIEDVRAFFLKQRKTWPSGERVTPFHAKEGSLARKVFLAKVLETTAEEDTRFWEKQKIVHGITPPTEFATVERAVFSIKGSVSYVLRKEHKDNVSKVLLVIPE